MKGTDHPLVTLIADALERRGDVRGVADGRAIAIADLLDRGGWLAAIDPGEPSPGIPNDDLKLYHDTVVETLHRLGPIDTGMTVAGAVAAHTIAWAAVDDDRRRRAIAGVKPNAE